MKIFNYLFSVRAFLHAYINVSVSFISKPNLSISNCIFLIKFVLGCKMKVKLSYVVIGSERNKTSRESSVFFSIVKCDKLFGIIRTNIA